jgi:uncharacterized protein
MFTNSPIANWRNAEHQYRLQGEICKSCKRYYFPKKYVCECGKMSFETIILKGEGILISFTTITTPPEEFKEMTPYCVGMIELGQGPRLISQIADVELCDLKIGMNMVSTFRKLYTSGEEGIIHYGLKFIPKQMV